MYDDTDTDTESESIPVAIDATAVCCLCSLAVDLDDRAIIFRGLIAHGACYDAAERLAAARRARRARLNGGGR